MPTIPDYTFKLHKKGDHMVAFFLVQRTSAATSYYQYESPDGSWYIVREVRTGAAVATDYYLQASPSTESLASGWTNRATRSYGVPSGIFA